MEATNCAPLHKLMIIINKQTLKKKGVVIMSTRAIVELKGEDGKVLTLYCSHDGYVDDGLGEDLYHFCKNQKKGISAPEILYGLLSEDDIDLETDGDDMPDFTYRITCSSEKYPELTCWYLDWSSKTKSFFNQCLEAPINIGSQDNNEGNEEIGILPCPYCGKHPWISSSSNKHGMTLKCIDDCCKGHDMIGYYQSKQEAEMAWNNACKQVKTKL